MKTNAHVTLLSLVIACAGLLSAPLAASAAPQLVPFGNGAYPVGSIIIIEKERKLYLIHSRTHAIRYPVAVARAGREWSGWARIVRTDIAPVWIVPQIVKRDKPSLPDQVPGGHPSNPLGAAALMLDRTVVDVPGAPPATVAIHGTAANMRKTIGSKASYGCVRMYNEDVLDLAQRVGRGTPVLMIRDL